jgi:hypothetical protein
MIFLESNWLNTETIFYNEKTLSISKNINDVIDYSNFNWHPEGLYNYVKFGYSVLGQTPIVGVKFLMPESSIQCNHNGILIKKNHDDVINEIDRKSNLHDTIDLIKKNINMWENNVKGDIIIPTSGGFDSRLINLLIENKERIQSFTYGISKSQSLSSEVIKAIELSKIVKSKWQQIELGQFHKFNSDWFDMYGVSTHLHGMYHMEFYSKINNLGFVNLPLVSGLIGDAWAGNVSIKEINCPEEIIKLGHSHGINADVGQLKIKFKNLDLTEKYFLENRYLLKQPKFRLIESMRFKMILLNYLLKIPEKYSFLPYAPFVNKEIALSMMNLPEHLKENRLWMRQYFSKYSLDLEKLDLKMNSDNSLDYIGSLKYKLEPLEITLLKEIFEENYISWINKNTLQRNKSRFKEKYLLKFPKINSSYDQKAYNAYVTLYPLQKLIQKRNEISKL